MAKQPYVVLARKYRPAVFDEVLGQPAVSVTLKNALSSKRIGQAYLFTGPRGVGKTTMARILAKALNCQEGPTPAPCLKCPACVEIASSSSMDVLEMDAASHTGVDNVREVIIETVALAPSRDRYKVFIIDEAHMLSTGAFNALLKTLEEPPAHVVFILATTELAKIPATIASRCQRFKFRPIAVEEMAAHLSSLAKKEKIDISREAVLLLARGAEGALRDAVSLLDQCRSYGDGVVSPELIREMFGLAPQEVLEGVVKALVGRQAAGLSAQLKRIYEEGVDPAQLLRDLRTTLEGAYLRSLGVESGEGFPESAALSGASSEELSFLLRRVNETLADMRSSDSPRLALELGLFGCLEAAGDLKAWLERLEALERRLQAGEVPVDKKSTQPSAPVSPLSPTEAWRRTIEALRQEKPSLALTLEAGRLSAGEKGPWRLVYQRVFDKEQAQRCLELIEAQLAREMGRAVRLSVELQEGQTPAAAKQPEPEKKSDSAGFQRAAQILGGTPRFIKKKGS
jgi:DNA polymerase-3 subunit gamma/tau